MMKKTVRFALSSLVRHNSARNSRWRECVFLPLLVLSSLTATAQQAQLTGTTTNAVGFGAVNIGSTSKPSTLTFTFTSPGSGVSVQVLTLGVKSGDFADAGTGSCTTNGAARSYATNDTCTVNITLTPSFNGPRNGAVELTGTNGQIVGSGYVYGTGYGPQLVYPSGTQSIVDPTYNFLGPNSLALDGAGNLYVVSLGSNAVEEYVLATGNVKTLGAGSFQLPYGISLDGAGNVYVADTYDNAVKEVLAVDGSVVTLGSSFKFSMPNGVAVDSSGNVYVADSGNNAVEEIMASNGSVQTLVKDFQDPVGIAVDGMGNVYVTSLNDGTVKEIATGSGSAKTLSANFTLPTGVAVDGVGNLYVTDTNGVSLISATDGSIHTVGSGFSNPNGVAVDAAGNVYVANFGTSPGNSHVVMESYATAPTLTFATPTQSGTLDTVDGPQTVSLQNIGSAPLMLSAASGANPSLTTGFSLASGATTCASANNTAAATTLLASDATCVYAVNFTPVATGAVQGRLTLTDNDAAAFGAATSASQVILLNGTGVGIATIAISGTLPAATAGVSYAGSFTASGGVAPYSFSATGLPPGLTLSQAGALTGNPTAGGAYMITVTATDANSFTGSATFPLSVAASTLDFQLTLANAGTQTIAAGASAQYSLTVSPVSGSFPFPVTFSVSGLPSGYSENFLPATMTPGSSTVQTQLTVHSTTNFAARQTGNPYGIVAAFLMLPLFGLRRLRRRIGRSLLAILLLSSGLAATVGLTGCVGNHINPATYNVVITATGNNFQHSVSTVLEVQ